MQNLTMYVLANSTLGTVRDSVNARNLPPPVFTRRFASTLNIRLFSEQENDTAYPIDQLQGIASWQCVWDKDFAQATQPLIVADNADIELHTVQETVGGLTKTFTELVVPISDMNSEALVAFLGDAEFKNGLIMELVGFDEGGDEVFGLQVKNFTIRNRVFLGTLNA